MITPNKLEIGDTIAFVAPARKVKKAELSSVVTILESWGLHVFFPEGLFLEENQFAGTDENRANHIQVCLDDSKIKALLCVRGGYGASRIIDSLDFSEFIKTPKWLIGFSDFTVILSHLYTLGVKSIHAPIALLLHQNVNVQNSLKAILFDRSPLSLLRVSSSVLDQFGSVEGLVVGGNLSVLVNQIGTKSFPLMEGCILFIEDLDEYLYHIDRMMIQLERIGVFSQIKGLVVGYMSGMHDNAVPFGKSAYEIIHSVVTRHNLVVGFGFSIGHKELNEPIVIGEKMKLVVSAEGASLTKI